MNTISSYGQSLRFQANLNIAQRQLADLQTQISTQKKSDRYSGIAGQASSSIELHSSVKLLETYDTNISRVGLQVDTSLSLMDRLGTIANEMRDAAITIRNGQEPDMSLLNAQARSRIEEVIGMLNGTVEGHYLFSGVQLGTQPMLPSATAQTDTANELNGYTDGDAATRLNNVRSYFAATANYYQGDTTATRLSAQVDVSINVSYNFRADDPSVQQILSGLYTLANLTYDTNSDAGFNTLLSGAIEDLDQGFDSLNQRVAELGGVREQVNTIRTEHISMTSLYKSQISEIEDVDTAAASSQLLNLQNQLQASYSVAAAIRSLSLVNFL